MPAYNASELMICAAAREIADGEVVFVGMRLPLLGFLLAKATHAPRAVGVYELGVVRAETAPAPILTMGDLPNLHRAAWLADTADVMGLLQSGRVDVSFIGGAQVDRFGNLNTTRVVGAGGAATRLPGSGGACDLACLARRHVIIMAHEQRRFVPQVDYITSPGYGTGPGWREREGLPRGGPASVITTLAVFRFDPAICEMEVASIHPGVSIGELRSKTGWPLRISSTIIETPAPSAAELAMIARFDPKRFWTGAAG
ncbi:MAG: CoA-transferase [Desulfobacterales bacterium]|jgi:glutaconate CoA-transferase subunit B|nr:CoA-transferase [Desulfobacterales bacterium]